MDGVLVDFVTGVCTAHNRPNPYSTGATDRDIAKLLGLKPREFWKPITHDVWATLPKTADHMSIIRLVSKYYMQDEVGILTSPSAGDESLTGKRAWLNANLPCFTRTCIFAEQKHLCCGPGKILIDDYDANVDAYNKAAKYEAAFLYPRPWNSANKQVDNALDLLESFLIKQCNHKTYGSV